MKSLAKRVGSRLKAADKKLVTAESCTGGWVAQAITAIPGSSDWFERGYVTYSNASKRELLGVRASTLARHGAVSEQTAREMARGAVRRGRGHVALAITGVAGPTGGSPGKPVGMVCFAWAMGRSTRSQTRHFRGGRDTVRRRSVLWSLQGILRCLRSVPRR